MNALICNTHPRAFFTPNLVHRGFFDDFLSTRRSDDEDITVASWVPSADIRESDDALVVDLELAGVKKDDIDISVESNVLKVTGQRRHESAEAKGSFQHVERFHGKFSRSFRLPRTVDSTKVNAVFEDGVLHLELPKSEEAKPRQVEIH
jgi:HSP20 family protein